MTVTALPRPATMAATDTGQHRAAVIRRARQAHGWTQADLARRAGYSQPTISRLERGGHGITDTAVLSHLAGILGIKPRRPRHRHHSRQ